MQYDYSKLLGKIREKKLTQVDFGRAIGLSETSVNLSLNNNRDFKQGEIIAACTVLDIPFASIDDYFFCPITLEN